MGYRDSWDRRRREEREGDGGLDVCSDVEGEVSVWRTVGFKWKGWEGEVIGRNKEIIDRGKGRGREKDK